MPSPQNRRQDSRSRSRPALTIERKRGKDETCAPVSDAREADVHSELELLLLPPIPRRRTILTIASVPEREPEAPIFDPAWIYDIIGGLGAAQIVTAYIALQLGKIDPRSILFSATNAVGAGAILVSLIDDFNLGAFVVEAFWLLVSLYGVFRALRNPPSASPETFA